MRGFGKFSKVLLGAASATAIATAAMAADAALPVEVPAAGFNWTGFYVGVGGGAGAVVHGLSTDLVPGLEFNGVGGEGIFGELTIGYDHVLGSRFLVGAFADAHIGNIGSELDVSIGVPLTSIFSATLENSYGFDAGLRLGYLVTPTTLAYALGGYSWQHFELETSVPGLAADWDADGYTVGVGMETVVSGNVTLKAEYRYSDYGTKGFFATPRIGNLLNVDTSTHTFHVAANYRFGAQNGGGATFESTPFNWTGFYIGVAGGAGASVGDLGFQVPPAAPIIDVGFNGIGGEGVFGELSVGYDYEFSNGFIAGIMIDGSLSGISTELNLGAIFPASASVDADWGFDILARLGMKVSENAMAYVIGGYSRQHFDVSISTPIPALNGSIYDWDADGFSVGGGIEAGLSEHLAVNLEYRYSQFEDEDFGTSGIFTAEPSSHTVRLGAKWKFNP